MAELTYLEVNVEFNPAAIGQPSLPLFTFSGSGIKMPEKQILVPSGIGIIVLLLTTQGEGVQAVFQTSPVQWFESPGQNPPEIPPSWVPIDTPGMFVVQRIGNNQVTILDFNSAQVSMQHNFNLVVAYEGNTYGSDPAIINEPPGS